MIESSASPERRGLSLRSIFAIAVVGALLMLFGSATLTNLGLGAAERRLDRALRSYEQLALVTRLEAEIGRLLLDEVSGIVAPGGAKRATSNGAAASEAVEHLITKISDEIRSLDDDAERASERKEYADAYAMRALLANMLAGIEREHRRSSHLDSGSAVRTFMANVSGDFAHLNGIVQRVADDERGEALATSEGLTRMRAQLAMLSLGSAMLASILAVLGALYTYRTVMRPLAELSDGATRWTDGDLGHRLTVAGPPEIARLAEVFNGMAGRLSEQHTGLLATNERLEDIVAERTRQLEEKATRLARIDDTRRLFFAKIGHELRTPLTALLGEADMALRRHAGATGGCHEALEHVVASGELLKRRIADMLALARSEDGRLTLGREPFDVIAAVRRAVTAARGYARSAEVELRLAMPDRCIRVTGDGDWLVQGLLAVIDNAIKFSPPAGTVDVSASADDTEITVEVRDTGQGVAEADIDRIFDAYVQASHGRLAAGSGLGLTVARWVADHHGGRISARNNAPHGLAIVLTLPVSA
jgi:signal transduction histidine kinase